MQNAVPVGGACRIQCKARRTKRVACQIKVAVTATDALCRGQGQGSRAPQSRYVEANADAAGDPDFGLQTATFHHPRNTALRTGAKLEEEAKHLRSGLTAGVA